MSLAITHLRLRNFRSFDAWEIEPDPKLTILTGPNAVGKTNCIEALQLLSAADSFRKPQWAECVRWGEQTAGIDLRAEGDGRLIETVLEVSASGRRVYRVNGTIKRRVADVTGLLPCVLFTPDDLRMVKDSGERRRDAIDGVGDQLAPAYAASRSEYQRILRQRNALLRETEEPSTELETWTQRLEAAGSSFSSHRKRLFERIAPHAIAAYASLVSEERLELEYVDSWDRDSLKGASACSSLREALVATQDAERVRRVTLVGPHRDDVRFLLDGRDARDYASQGQQRTIALSWKLAEVAVMTEIGGQPPILLLDDVMSELDESRRHALATFVGDAAQTFMTTTNLGYFSAELVERAKVVSLG